MTTKEEFYDQGVLQAKDNNTRCIEESILDNMPVGTIQVVDDSLFLSRSQKKRKAKKKKDNELVANIMKETDLKIDLPMDNKGVNNVDVHDKGYELDNTLKSKIENPTPLGNVLKFNPFMVQADGTLPRITLKDPFITTINSIIEKELGLTKLNEENINMLIGIVNARGIPD